MEEIRMNEVAEETTALAAKPATEFMTPGAVTMWNNVDLMKANIQTAKILAGAAAIPDTYKGKLGDCLIAIDLSNRMGISPIAIMQFSQVVKGNFSWKGQACKALIDNCGKFNNSRYVMFGEPGTMERGCKLVATDKRTGETVEGPAVTMQMAKDEGWYDKTGSKWKTMPELMLKYRAAAFFARTECPEALMGFYTSDEMRDIKGYESEQETTVISISA